MKIAPVADIKAHFSDYIKKSGEGPIVVTKHGKPVAVLLGLKDEEEIERLLIAYSTKFQDILERGRQQIQQTGGIEHDQFWKEVDTEAE
jgi:prevent-host-death family protein